MAIAQQRVEPPALHTARRLPPLENGDYLTRAEFERRYDAMPGLKKAELIEGVVYMGSPVRLRAHGQPHGWVLAWLGAFSAATPNVELASEATVRLDLDNEPQPDALLLLNPADGGRARVSDDDYVEGAPELVVEVAASSASIDLHAKLNVYRRAGVQEYIVWRVLERRIDWFELREGEYFSLEPDERGVVHGRVFPGLRLAVPALLAGDLAAVLAEQQAGLNSPEHRQFVAAGAARLST